MKFLLNSPKNRTAYNFRGELIKSIIDKGYEVVVTGPNRIDVDKIEQLGARFVEIKLNKTGTSIIDDLKYLKQLTKLTKQEQPDVILGYTIKPVVYGSIAGYLAGIKNINSMITGLGYTFISNTTKAKVLGIIVRFLYKIGLACSKNIIFQNSDDLDEFCNRRLVKKEKCYVVNGSGVDTKHFKPVLFPKETTFFMLSRLLKSKGVGEYLKAAELVKTKYPNIKFNLLGKYETNMQDAIPKDEIEYYINKGVINRFEETNDVRPYYEKCSVYVLPSYREGTPRTVLEAMSMGRPIITTDVPGCRQTTVNNKTGFLVSVKDHKTLADVMIKFIENPGLIQDMGQESRKYAEEKYDVNIINKNMMDIMNIGV